MAAPGPNPPPAPVQQQQTFPPPPPYFSRLAPSAAPPPVIDGEYLLLGELHTTQDGLPPLRVRQLFETRPDGSVDHRGQLLALHRELVANTLELLSVLVDKPSGYARQVENVGLVLRNMQYLLNQLRPVQAGATLAAALQRQAEERRAGAEALRAAVERAEAAVREAAAALRQVPTKAHVVGSDEAREPPGDVVDGG